MFSTPLLKQLSVAGIILFGVASADNLSSNDDVSFRHRELKKKKKKKTRFCTREYIPVLCGDDNDEFSNMCLAKAAGYHKRQCTTMEPEPALLGGMDRQLKKKSKTPVGCPYVYEPVLCGDEDEEFPSLCEAEAAGYHKRQCTAKTPEPILRDGINRALRGISRR